MIMENKTDIIAHVKSPARGGHLRIGSGFSREEIKGAGKDIHQLRTLNIGIDYFRKSVYSENIEKLKKLKIPDKVTKKKPIVKKEKKTTPFKPIKEPKIKPKKIIKEAPKVPAVKKKVEAVKKEKTKPVKKEKVKIEEVGVPLTKLSGLGAAIAKKFNKLGVSTIEELCKENSEELAALVKGVSVDRINKWIEEGKELINS